MQQNFNVSENQNQNLMENTNSCSFGVRLKTGDGDWEGRGKKNSLWALSEMETFLQWSGRSQKNGEFCPNKVLVNLFVCLWSVNTEQNGHVFLRI